MERGGHGPTSAGVDGARVEGRGVVADESPRALRRDPEGAQFPSCVTRRTRIRPQARQPVETWPRPDGAYGNGWFRNTAEERGNDLRCALDHPLK